MNVTYPVEVLDKKQLTENIIVFTTTKPTDFAMQSGQFIQFVVSDGEKNVKRAYSICSTPHDSHLEFCAKIYSDGVASQVFVDMQPGDALEITPARGRFVLTDDIDTTTAFTFVATGTGIAPIKGLVTELLKHQKVDVPIDLYFGLRHEEDIFWLDYFNELTEKHSNFNFYLTLSQGTENWTKGLNGRVTAHVAHINPDSHIYICGSAPMVMDMKKGLTEKNIPPQQIHFEIF